MMGEHEEQHGNRCASTSFSGDQIDWLYAVMQAVDRHDRAALEKLIDAEQARALKCKLATMRAKISGGAR